jgi:uncharacterized repeat protein (TIGR03803 family)
MRRLAVRRYILSISSAAALLSACGGPQPPIATPGEFQQNAALSPRTDGTKYKVVYSFGVAPDGASPRASVIDVGGTLYGTTVFGGPYICISSVYGCGTVFSITAGGTEKVLYSFGKDPDGSAPEAGLINVSGILYGTTEYGGSHYCHELEANCGTVFTITTAGTEKVLHSFRGGPHDGSAPAAPLLDVNGTLYGTTQYGGKYCSEGGCGTVFSITAGGSERILYSFGGPPDGAYPEGLVEVNGTLYGVTGSGGANGAGTVFSVSLGGVEKVLHSFGPYSHSGDGSYPVGNLVVLRGALYGTTVNGGKHHGDHGTVFSITTGGAEKVLHSFSGSDGTFPAAGLVEVGGTLYGTTSAGGAHNCYSCGTIFSITPSGKEKVLHSFGKGTDGGASMAAMYYDGGKLFGTTSAGGVHGNGTVFSLTP